MPTPMSRSAYEAEFDILDRAIESERGVQRLFEGEEARGQAYQFRTRLNKARADDRMNSMRIYKPDHPEYNQTAYACIIVRDPYWDSDKGAWVVQLVKNDPALMVVEEIPADE